MKDFQFLLPATKLQLGYVFTGVCDSVHGRGVSMAGEMCMVGGMHGRGRAWQGGCTWQGGMCGRGGVW